MAGLEMVLPRCGSQGRRSVVRISWDRRSQRCTLFLFFCSLVQQLGEILFLASNTFGNLDNNTTPLQLDFFALIKFPVATPVHVSNKVAPLIVDHNAFVERVVFDSSILPSFLFSLQVVGEQAHKLKDRRGRAAAMRRNSLGPGRSRGHERRHFRRRMSWKSAPLLRKRHFEGLLDNGEAARGLFQIQIVQEGANDRDPNTDRSMSQRRREIR